MLSSFFNNNVLILGTVIEFLDTCMILFTLLL